MFTDTRMLKTLGCVLLSSAEAMPVSNRLGTFAGRQLAGVPLVDWVVRRATEAQKLSDIVVVVPSECDEAELRKLVPPDVEVFVTPSRMGWLKSAIVSNRIRLRPWSA